MTRWTIKIGWPLISCKGGQVGQGHPSCLAFQIKNVLSAVDAEHPDSLLLFDDEFVGRSDSVLATQKLMQQ